MFTWRDLKTYIDEMEVDDDLRPLMDKPVTLRRHNQFETFFQLFENNYQIELVECQVVNSVVVPCDPEAPNALRSIKM